jgi:hypothetical protein
MLFRSLQRQSASLLPALFRALDVTAPSTCNGNAIYNNTAVFSRVVQQQQRHFSSHRHYTSEAADENWRSIQESFTSIIVGVDDTGIATVTINRPESLNALNTKVRKKQHQKLE